MDKTKTRTWDHGIITETERTTFDSGKYNETVRVKEDGFLPRTISTTYTTGKEAKKK